MIKQIQMCQQLSALEIFLLIFLVIFQFSEKLKELKGTRPGSPLDSNKKILVLQKSKLERYSIETITTVKAKTPVHYLRVVQITGQVNDCHLAGRLTEFTKTKSMAYGSNISLEN